MIDNRLIIFLHQVESQTGWSSGRKINDRSLTTPTSIHVSHHTSSGVISPIHQLSSTAQSIRNLLTPTHHQSQIIRNTTPQHLAPPPFGRTVSNSSHSRSTSDIPSVHGNSPQSPDSSYIRKWLGEAAALVSAVKIPQTVQFSSSIGFSSNLSSTPPPASALSSTPPLTDSHLSSTPPLTDSQLSISPPFTVAHLPTTPISNSLFANSHSSATHFASSPIHSKVASTPPSLYFPSTPLPSASFLHSSGSPSYLPTSSPPISASYVPSTPPPSAEYFPSTPPTSSYLAFSSERGSKMSTDALRHSQLLQARLAEVVAARRSSWIDGSEILSNAAKIQSPSIVASDILTEKNSITSVGNYNTWSGRTNPILEDKTLDWRLKEMKSDKNLHQTSSLSEEYPSFKYTPETKIPEVYDKPDPFKLATGLLDKDTTKSFLGFSTTKATDYLSKESDWSITNRVKNIFDDIKKNAMSDFAKQREEDESNNALKLNEEKNKSSQFGSDWWSTFTDRNKLSEDLSTKKDWVYSTEVGEDIRSGIDLIKTSDSERIIPLNNVLTEEKITEELEAKKLDDEVAETLKITAQWSDNTHIDAKIMNDTENISVVNSKNAIKSEKNDEFKDENSNNSKNIMIDYAMPTTTPPQILDQKENDNKNKTPTMEEATFKRSGREGRRGSDGARERRGSRGDTPPLSRESRGSFKRARRGSGGEGGSPVGGGAMVEECIIRPRVEAEKSSDEEVAEVTVSTELLREGSEFSKTLKGVQTEMDSLTRLTDNVFYEKKNNAEANAVQRASASISRVLNERPKVLGGENIESVVIFADNVSNNINDHSVVNFSSASEHRRSWAGIDSNNRDAKSDSRDSRDSDKSSMSTSSSKSDVESESTKRVRAYLDSINPRFKPQMTISSSSESQHSSSTAASSRLVSMSSSETPPMSARLMSCSSSETPPSSACPMSLTSSETPPNSADAVAGTPGSRPSLSDTPPSPAFFAPTPPLSAGFGSNMNSDPAGSGESVGAYGTGGAGLLQRTTSCDSINSDTSVTLGELEEAVGQVTAQLSVTLIYDG